jgi:putative membrane-bound dehydrogenase-like protein
MPETGFKCVWQCGLLWLILMLSQAGRAADTPDSLGVQVTPGFTVTRFAGDELAHDIFSMTLDSLGRVVVSGPGYIKILIDADQDGIAERAEVFVNGPEQGAQGMYFVGRDLICSAGAGLIRYRDRDANNQADGPPDVFLNIRTGSEHNLHAIRKGPDGWWYLNAGNAAGVDHQYAALPTSPVKKPHAGVILRLKPDLTQGEIYAHGFRNAYDFDFHDSGELFSFDSDGEKVTGLPAYQPTRLFHVLPGSHQGWITDDWIRPDHYFDMAPIVASFGRGSPTGMATYRHTAFPDSYHGALFLLDWTYGRVYAVHLKREGSTWKGEPELFLSAVGQHGFAPTDIEVGPGGELYVCTGGRGTRGCIYCIRPQTKNPKSRPWPGGSGAPTARSDRLNVCLQAPQPLSSWSRRVWEPLAKALTSEPFVSAALDRSRPAEERVRAIEILTEQFKGIGGDLAAQLAADENPLIRARAAWSLGRTSPTVPPPALLRPFLNDPDPAVARVAVEACLAADDLSLTGFVDSLGRQIANPDRYVRQAGMRVLTRANLETVHKIAQIGFPQGWHAAIPVAASYAVRIDGFASYPLDISLRILKGPYAPALKLEAARVLQLGLGDVTPPAGEAAPVYDGYAARVELSAHAETVQRLGKEIAAIYPLRVPEVDLELERAMGMIQSSDQKFFAALLTQLTDDSEPVEDIHRLIVASRLPVARTDAQSRTIAAALLKLDRKIKRRNIQQDSSWEDRIMEMTSALVEQDRLLPAALLSNPDFGQSGHALFVQIFPENLLKTCAEKFLIQIQSDPNYHWNANLVYLLGGAGGSEGLRLIRGQFQDLSLRGAIVTTLGSDPQEQDRPLYLAALQTGTTETMRQCLEALQLLPASTDGPENVILARTLRRLGDRGEERAARDQAVEVLRRNLGLRDDYQLGQEGEAQLPAMTQILNGVQQRFPAEFSAALAAEADTSTLQKLQERLAGISWIQGSALRGSQVFQTRGCVQCHGQGQALGPDLTGVAGRFSRGDLFTAIVFPNQDVSPRYQIEQVVLTDGRIRQGMIVYEAVDGLVLRDGNNHTYRIEAEEIETRRPLPESLMPSGLLKGATDQDFADLYAYLQSLGLKSAALPDSQPAN